MNQILNLNNKPPKNDYLYSSYHNKKITIYKFIFILCLASTIFLLCFFIKFLININYRNEQAEDLAKQFTLTSLYSNNQSYSINIPNTVEENSDEQFIIGVIKIDKIKIDYPILSSTTDELLTIAPCRFAGPMPNKIGNLCIAGHNYIDNTFFAKITKLEKGDEILIYDLSGNMTSYYVTDKFEVENTDFSCTTQDTNGEKWLTLMTCNSLKGTRIIVRAISKA